MLGIIFGLGGLAYFIQTTVTDGWQVSGWSLAFSGLLIAVVGATIGLVFRLTVGMAAFWWSLGAVIGAVIAFVKGEPGIGLPLVANGVVFFGLQHFLAAVTRGGRARRPGARVPLAPSQPIRMSARGYYGVLVETMLSEGGPGTMTVFQDGSSEFITDREIRWSFGVEAWASWRSESRVDVLAEIPGLRPAVPTLVLNGGTGLMRPAIYVQPVEVDEWADWAQELNIPQEASR